MKPLSIFLVCVGLCATSCGGDDVNPELEDLLEELNEEQFDNSHSGAVVDCDDFLSPVEMTELWETMNAKIHNNRHICFEGYVYSDESFGDLYQGSIALNEFTQGDEYVPTVHCQFDMGYGEVFRKYEVGDKIKIKGKLVAIDESSKHNFKFMKCSVGG